jgi:acetyltransferase-like isoleucine patch superfamily enzyme
MPEIIEQVNVISGKGTLYNSPIKIVPPKEGVEFGNYCAIAPNLKIIGVNHDYNFPSIQETFYKKYFNSEHPISKNSNIRSKGKVIIGNDVWIGEDVVILSGITIGDGCCIGARSVVTKNLEPYSICVGTPCKSVKLRYSKEIINFLLDLKWWNWDDTKIKRNKEFFMTDLNEITDINQIHII